MKDPIIVNQEQYNQSFIEWIEAIHTEQLEQGKFLKKMSTDIRDMRNLMILFAILLIIEAIIQFI